MVSAAKFVLDLTTLSSSSFFHPETGPAEAPHHLAGYLHQELAYGSPECHSDHSSRCWAHPTTAVLFHGIQSLCHDSRPPSGLIAIHYHGGVCAVLMSNSPIPTVWQKLAQWSTTGPDPAVDCVSTCLGGSHRQKQTGFVCDQQTIIINCLGSGQRAECLLRSSA